MKSLALAIGTFKGFMSGKLTKTVLSGGSVALYWGFMPRASDAAISFAAIINPLVAADGRDGPPNMAQSSQDQFLLRRTSATG